jgi:hypothetical protein
MDDMIINYGALIIDKVAVYNSLQYETLKSLPDDMFNQITHINFHVTKILVVDKLPINLIYVNYDNPYVTIVNVPNSIKDIVIDNRYEILNELSNIKSVRVYNGIYDIGRYAHLLSNITKLDIHFIPAGSMQLLTSIVLLKDLTINIGCNTYDVWPMGLNNLSISIIHTTQNGTCSIENLPPNLESLFIDTDDVEDDIIKLTQQRLPNTLKSYATTYYDNNIFDIIPDGVKYLSIMNYNDVEIMRFTALETLILNTNNVCPMIGQVISNLPQSLKTLDLQVCYEIQITRLPKNLVNLTVFMGSQQLIDIIPPSLRNLRIDDTVKVLGASGNRCLSLKHTNLSIIAIDLGYVYYQNKKNKIIFPDTVKSVTISYKSWLVAENLPPDCDVNTTILYNDDIVSLPCTQKIFVLHKLKYMNAVYNLQHLTTLICGTTFPLTNQMIEKLPTSIIKLACRVDDDCGFPDTILYLRLFNGSEKCINITKIPKKIRTLNVLGNFKSQTPVPDIIDDIPYYKFETMSY